MMTAAPHLLLPKQPEQPAPALRPYVHVIYMDVPEIRSWRATITLIYVNAQKTTNYKREKCKATTGIFLHDLDNES